MAAIYPMMTTVLAMTAIGIGLGLRFKAFVLVPAIAISSIVNFAIDLGHVDSFWSILPATIFSITALQIGYLGGAIARFSLARVRARKQPSAIIVVAQKR